MDIKKLLKKAVLATCVYFTLVTVAYMLCMHFITTGDNSPSVETTRVFFFLAFSFLWAIADAIRSIKIIPHALGRTVHFVICTFAFYTCFMLAMKMNPSNILTGLIIFTIVYWIFVALKALFSSRLRRNREQNELYGNQFNLKK